MDSKAETSSASPSFKIGAVERITGISVHTLRIWEKRYPQHFEISRNENGRREYREEDVSRLTLLKALVEKGMSIGDVVGESQEKLQGMLVSLNGRDRKNSRKTLLVFGETLPATLQANKSLGALVNIIYCGDKEEEFKDKLDQLKVSPDIIIIEADHLTTKNLFLFRSVRQKTKSSCIIAVYHYAHRELLSQLKALEVMLWRAPIGLDQVVQAIGGLSESDDCKVPEANPLHDAPARIFTKEQLIKLSNVESDVDCECPSHLVDLIISMSAFESYSQQCESKNLQDAKLHNEIYKITAKARHMMEDVLQKVMDFEGITLNNIDGKT